jgi:dTDP-4-amino-4,6-dideoxygalactose transaminase
MTHLRTQHNQLKEEINDAIARVVDSGRFILGPEVEAFEQEMAEYCGTKFAIGVASGSDALLLSLISCGVKPGDEVITTPFTFIATAMAATHIGAIPVFVDIDPKTYNINAEKIESRITNKTKVILPVHLFGQATDMEPVMALAKTYHLKVVEDCAQALSASYKGHKVGSIGHAGCFSFFPSKNLGAFGDAGMVLTSEPEIYEAIKMLRQHGARSTYFHILPGFNSRLDAFQAAVLRVKFKHLDEWSELRRRKFELYNSLLHGVGNISTPQIDRNNITSANYYTIRLDDQIERDRLRQHLVSNGIETNIYYPLSLHLQDVYKNLGYKTGNFPEAEKAQERVLSLPMFPELPDEHVAEVASAIKEYCLATATIK